MFRRAPTATPLWTQLSVSLSSISDPWFINHGNVTLNIVDGSSKFAVGDFYMFRIAIIPNLITNSLNN
jgi:hypothetical protein